MERGHGFRPISWWLSRRISGGGVYIIRHREGGKQYVGKTDRFTRRLKEHLRKAGKVQMAVSSALAKHGAEAFDLMLIPVKEEGARLALEAWLVGWMNTITPHGYNISSGGEVSPFKGRTHTDAAKQVMREKHAGKTLSDEHRAKIAASLRGGKRTPEQRATMSRAQKRVARKPLTEKHKENISKGSLGKKDTEETKRRKSESGKKAWEVRRQRAAA